MARREWDFMMTDFFVHQSFDTIAYPGLVSLARTPDTLPAPAEVNSISTELNSDFMSLIM